MKDIGYVFRRLLDMNYKQMFEKLNSLHKKTGKSRLWLLRDMQRCAVNYGAGYMDYDLYEMYDLTPAQRDTYLTRGRNNALVKQFNDLNYAHCFDNKDEFYTLFAAYIGRKWVRLSDKEAALNFIREHDRFIAKPLVGSCGKGVELVDTAKYASAVAVYESLEALKAPYALEEIVRQHPAVSAIYPDSVNTVRAVTLLKDGVPHVITTCFRIGNGGRHVDNFNSGGMVAPVDENTGTVTAPAIVKDKTLHVAHPQTGIKIQGFQFPDWEKAMDMVKRAALVVPQMAYLGWDVAFTPDGPCLIEGNNFPGHDLYQLPEHTPDKIGIMEKFRI